MLDRNKLNRVKGILSAQLGAEIPKYDGGAKFTKKNPYNVTIYSNDGVNWFNDLALQVPYMGTTDGFNSVNKDTLQYEIPGGSTIDINTAIELAVNHLKQTELKKEEFKSHNAALQDFVKQSVNNLRLDFNEVSPLNNSPKKLEVPLLILDLQKEQFQKLQEQQKQQKQQKQEKFNEVVGTTAQIGTLVFQGIGDAFGAQQAVTDSSLTKGADALYDNTAEAVKKLGPTGLIVGTALGFAGTAGDIIQGLGGGTDQMTTTDKWMDSSFFSWNVGMLNGFGGKKSDAFAADKDILASVGSSYGGTTDDINNAAAKANKKYGLFSSSARRRANRLIAAARAKLNIMGDISEEATDLRLAVLSMGELAGLAYSIMTDGGYNLKYTYAAKHGGLLEWNPIILLEWEPQVELNWELPEFKEGGSIDLVEELEWIPEFKDGSKTRTLELLFEYAKKENPRFILRLSESPKGIDFIDENGELVNGSHLLSYSTDGEGNAIVFPQILEMEDGSLHYFENWKDAYDRAIKNKNILKMSLKEAELFFAEDPEYRTAYKRGWPNFFKSYKKGGTLGNDDMPKIEETTLKNVIPEGALHKNKHHMEHAEGLTKKGIPVIDEDGEQLAEIEHSEIIFTLEVTKKLEEYYEIFYSDESSNKEKEQAALDAGKLLVYQILENTEDRTGLIESCKKGGSLTLKKSTDDLIEEVLDWMPTLMVVEEVIEEVKEEEKPKKKSEKELMKEAIKEVLIELLTK